MSFLILARDFPSIFRYALLDCPNPCHQARRNADLDEDVMEMKLNGFFADANFCSNSFISSACKNQLENLELPRREI